MKSIPLHGVMSSFRKFIFTKMNFYRTNLINGGVSYEQI